MCNAFICHFGKPMILIWHIRSQDSSEYAGIPVMDTLSF